MAAESTELVVQQSDEDRRMVTQWMPRNPAGELVRDVALACEAGFAESDTYNADVEIGEADDQASVSLILYRDGLRLGEIGALVTTEEGVFMITLGKNGHRLAGGLRETPIDREAVAAAMAELVALITAQ